MKTLRYAVLAAVLAAPGFAQSVGTAQATIDLLSGVFLVKDRDLNFGSVVQPTTAGSIAVAPTGATTPSAGLVHLGGSQSAAFTASSSDNANQHFWIQLPSSVSLTGPATLTARDFLASANLDTRCISYSGTRPASAAKSVCPSVKTGQSFSFDVGATVDLNANQPVGTYTGTFTVTLHQF